jgi:hypothetical protein
MPIHCVKLSDSELEKIIDERASSEIPDYACLLMFLGTASLVIFFVVVLIATKHIPYHTDLRGLDVFFIIWFTLSFILILAGAAIADKKKDKAKERLHKYFADNGKLPDVSNLEE